MLIGTFVNVIGILLFAQTTSFYAAVAVRCGQGLLSVRNDDDDGGGDL